MMQITESDTPEALAIESIELYEKMIAMLGELPAQLASQSTASIEKFNASFAVLQQQVKCTDLQLPGQLMHVSLSENVRQLLVRRKFLQERVLQLVKESVSGASSIKSLLASEMQSLKSGRRALSGYKVSSDRQGTIINSRR